MREELEGDVAGGRVQNAGTSGLGFEVIDGRHFGPALWSGGVVKVVKLEESKRAWMLMFFAGPELELGPRNKDKTHAWR